jgi:hypothetical protein
MEAHDTAGLEADFTALAGAGCFHFYRSGTGMAGETWADRLISPADVDTVAKMTDRGYDTFGLRSMHCIFMDGAAFAGMESQATRERVVDAFAAMLVGREHKFLCIEIVNELDNGDKIPWADAKALAMRLQARTAVPVIISRVVFGRYAEMYANTGLKLATAHLERQDSGDGGAWEHLSKPNEYPPDGESADPTAFISGEPKGPGSSGQSEYNVLRLVMGYVCTILEGMCGHVFHTGPGLRSGGFWDQPSHRMLDGRAIPARLADLPEWAPVVAGFKTAQQYMPADLANWQRWRGHWPESPLNFIWFRNEYAPGQFDNGPFDSDENGGDSCLFKAYVTARGNQVLAVALRVRKPIKVTHRTHTCQFEVLDPVTGAVLQRETHPAGEWMTITPREDNGWNPDGDGLVIRGTLL